MTAVVVALLGVGLLLVISAVENTSLKDQFTGLLRGELQPLSSATPAITQPASGAVPSGGHWNPVVA